MSEPIDEQYISTLLRRMGYERRDCVDQHRDAVRDALEQAYRRGLHAKRSPLVEALTALRDLHSLAAWSTGIVSGVIFERCKTREELAEASDAAVKSFNHLEKLRDAVAAALG